MARITLVRALPSYRLLLKFDDGAEGTVDLSDMVGQGVFSAWKDPAAFAQVSLDPETGAVCWPGGIDLCLDTLHHDITGSPLPGSSVASLPR